MTTQRLREIAANCEDVSFVASESNAAELREFANEIDGCSDSAPVTHFADTPDPVRADPDDEPDLTPEQEAELQADFEKWIKVRVDPVREELLAALKEAERWVDYLVLSGCDGGAVTGSLKTIRKAIARAESPVPPRKTAKDQSWR